MKKVLTLALCLVMLAALVIPVAAALNITAPKATIVVDGVKDDVYGEPVEVKAMRDGNPGATAKLWSAWDDNNLYYYIEVNDTTPFHNHADSYQRDNVEIFFDWFSNGGEESANDDKAYWQIRIMSAPNDDGVGLEATVNGSGDESYADEIMKTTVIKPLVGSDLNGGYIIETALPFKLVEGGFKPSENMTIIVDLQAADNQADEGRTSQAFMEVNDLTDNQWQNPSACTGLLKLGAAAAAPVVETKDEPAPETPVAVQESTPEPTPAPVQSAPATGDMTIVFCLIAILGAAVVSFRIIKSKA